MKFCCFIGHRNTLSTPELYCQLKTVILHLIQEKNVSFFLFGSKSHFDSLCLQIVSEIQKEYPHIQRIYVRSQYSYIEEWYKKSLLKNYEDTIFPSGLDNAGKSSYIKRNKAMIDASDFCVFYYNAEYNPPPRKSYKQAFSNYQSKSGTTIAYAYAKQKKKEIINLYKQPNENDLFFKA